MISQSNSSALRNAYMGGDLKAKPMPHSGNETTSVAKQGDTSRVDSLKSSIASGEYKVNLDALAEKIAEQLL
ncbi:MAG: flagellar biosynthesis anti-sigma factor FlgM [Helicobacteraceae bacterium]|nr:flagellar biosynthesis anti-sigma factor FlgM [Helicobacteraceae bacterium]